MSQNLNSAFAVIGIDIGKNSFHVIGLDRRGAIVLRQKWSRGQSWQRCQSKAAKFTKHSGSLNTRVERQSHAERLLSRGSFGAL
jgi:hypothetical protein